jgi:hypothetical protein
MDFCVEGGRYTIRPKSAQAVLRKKTENDQEGAMARKDIRDKC